MKTNTWSEAQLTPELAKQIIDNKIGAPCILCAGVSDLAGVFTPSDSQSWGAPNGKYRLLVYSLCSDCKDTQDALEKVEAVMNMRLGLESVN